VNTINTILIANRGEIARRVIRTCRRLGIRSIAVYSEADRAAAYVREADLALHIGEAAAAKSYLDQDKILDAARRAGADAIHPGYGFLSENAAFARRCREAGLIFIGPHPEAIEQMGSKSRAKTIMQEHGVPVIPGYQGEDQSVERLSNEMERTGFPLLLKAAAGGGGKGMRIVNAPEEMKEAISAAKREARAAFGDDELIVERYFPSARHIEFQIFGDQHGNAIHLNERECSIQRRYQKVIEESPSPALNEAIRQKMGEAAVNAAKAINYDNAGTVEFIYAGEGEFYFLEVNTRLQVEHPVTEMITGVDLVREQIRVATGAPLGYDQDAIRFNGHSIECRINAEDPETFAPSPGRISSFHAPGGLGVRVDSAIYEGYKVPPHYDSLIAKLIVHGTSRNECLMRLRRALEECVISGIKTNLPLHARLISEQDFINGDYDIHWLETLLGLRKH
jgi:acetyl-CoA carboxylase biotin carboxylase subunit